LRARDETDGFKDAAVVARRAVSIEETAGICTTSTGEPLSFCFGGARQGCMPGRVSIFGDEVSFEASAAITVADMRFGALRMPLQTSQR
jgi:hypothetical protein